MVFCYDKHVKANEGKNRKTATGRIACVYTGEITGNQTTINLKEEKPMKTIKNADAENMEEKASLELAPEKLANVSGGTGNEAEEADKKKKP